MKIAGVYNFEASLETAWNALFDAEVLARTLPGCDKLEREGDQFNGIIRVKMGPVQGKFQGKVDIEDVQERESYRMVIDGRGPAGFAKAKVFIRLVAQGDQTEMTYEADVQIGGRIASVGQRLLDASVKAITKQSLESLHAQIKALQAAANTSSETVAAEDASDSAAEPASGESLAAAEPLASEGPSQVEFAMGIAKEVTKDLFPLKKVILVGVVIVLVVALYQVLSQP